MMRTTRPVTVSVTWLLWLTLMAGCGDTPMTPSPPTLSPPSAQFTLSGVVYEHTPAGVRPLAGVPLDISQPGTSRRARLTSDAEGRYQVPSLPPGEVKVNAESPDHLQPCRAAITLTGNSSLDVHVVPVEAVRASGIPPSFSVLQPTLSGRLFERTPHGLESVPDASLVLDFSGGDGWDPGARSISDSSGQFFFCNIAAGAGSGLGISAEKEGYRSAYVPVGRPVESTTVDVELVRH
jgi:Carboxypeptidase regulatory-like domain